MRLFEVIPYFSLELKKNGISPEELDFLLASALRCKRSDLYLDSDRNLNQEEILRCKKIVEKRVKGEPLAYIEGEVSFYGVQLHIGQQVLIPRQETEILADKIYQDLKAEDLKGKTLWDLFTGSGCLGIALKKKLSDLNVALSDLSEEALSLAKQNAKRNQAEVSFHRGDLFAPFQGTKAHFIVCNPPYVSESEFITLDPGVRDFEPKMALVGGKTGYEFYERLAAEYQNFLYPQGKLWLEIGKDQGDRVRSLFDHRGIVLQDWSGHDRFFFLERD